MNIQPIQPSPKISTAYKYIYIFQTNKQYLFAYRHKMIFKKLQTFFRTRSTHLRAIRNNNLRCRRFDVKKKRLNK